MTVLRMRRLRLGLAIIVTCGLAFGGAAFACNGATTYIDDHFDGLAASWGPADQEFFVKDGKLVVTAVAGRNILQFLNGYRFPDLDACVTATIVEGNDLVVAGLTFGTSRNEAYVFVYSPDGKAAIFLQAGNKQRISVNWKSAPMLHPGLGQANRLRLLVSGTAANFFINDVFFAGALIHRSHDDGNLGVIISGSETTATVTFDDFKVTDPSE